MSGCFVITVLSKSGRNCEFILHEQLLWFCIELFKFVTINYKNKIVSLIFLLKST